MAVKNYLINDKWLDIDKQNIVEVKSTDGVIGSVKVNGEEYGGSGGGGSSSDFSIAKVNIVTRAEEGAGLSGGIYNAVIINADGELTSTSVIDGSNDEWNIVLYKGTGTYGAENIISVEGSASYDSEEETVTITGDCTITLYYNIG